MIISAALPQKHGIPLFVNPVSRGIAGDWNFAYRQADAQYVTIAHQDDTYLKGYAKMICESISGPDSLIFFSDYYEISGDTVIKEKPAAEGKGKNELSAPLPCISKKAGSSANGFFPWAVPFAAPPLRSTNRFSEILRLTIAFCCDLDWDAWSRIAEMKGAFVYIHRSLMCHRIHEQSETNQTAG